VKLKRWCVTVMDNETPTREFWTMGGAVGHFLNHTPASHLYRWTNRSSQTGWERVRFPSHADTQLEG